jgi:hypothetical protein
MGTVPAASEEEPAPSLVRVPQEPQAKQARSTAAENANRHAAWAASYAPFTQLSAHYDGSIAGDVAARRRAQQAEEFRQRVRAKLPLQCPCCASEAADVELLWVHDGPAGDAATLSYVTALGSVEVPKPRYKCRHCSFDRRVHPLEMGCFPSTPQRAEAWFDDTLMDLVHTLRCQAPYPANSLAIVFGRTHSNNGMPSTPGVLRHLGTAANHWQAVQEAKAAAARQDSATPAAWSECPACWRECVAISGDACLGLRRFQKAASSSMELQPLGAGDLFVPDAAVQQALDERGDSAADTLPSCSNFKAATLFARRVDHYDRFGVAGFVCRHGFAVCMASLFTDENFTYYDVLLDTALQRVSPRVVFMDVACKYEAHYQQ